MPPVPVAGDGPAALLIFGIAALVVGFLKGWVVPGFIYQREVKRGDTLDAALRRCMGQPVTPDDREGS